jgi:hypothetical protein
MQLMKPMALSPIGGWYSFAASSKLKSINLGDGLKLAEAVAWVACSEVALLQSGRGEMFGS